MKSETMWRRGSIMQSIRSRLIISLIKNRHLFKLKFKPDVVDAKTFSVEAFRTQVEKVSSKVHEDINVEVKWIDDIYCEKLVLKDAPEDKIIMYIHGGGFISGSCQSHRVHVSKVVKASKHSAFVFNYRLAPEHPFPAAQEDCVKVYRGLLDSGYLPENIILAGESAGGSLVLATLLAIKQEKIKMPKAAVSISPVVDLRCLAESFKYNAKNDIAPIGSWDLWTQMYIGETDPITPLLSPYFGELDGLPPLYLCVGTYEIHLDDVKSIYEKAKQEGVEVKIKVWERMVHAFPLLSPFFPEAKRALDEIGEFIETNFRH